MGRQSRRRQTNRNQDRQNKTQQIALDAQTRAEQYGARDSLTWTLRDVPSIPDVAINEWLKPMLPLWIPLGWKLHTLGADGWMFIDGPPSYLKLICSGETHLDGRRWMHCSLTGPDRMPTWDEQVAVKEAFCGMDSLAVMVMPPRAEWVNHDFRCLHWWICADGRPLPDFTQGRKMI